MSFDYHRRHSRKNGVVDALLGALTGANAFVQSRQQVQSQQKQEEERAQEIAWRQEQRDRERRREEREDRREQFAYLDVAAQQNPELAPEILRRKMEYVNGTKRVVPGFDYRPKDGSQPPSTVGGFPTHIDAQDPLQGLTLRSPEERERARVLQQVMLQQGAKVLDQYPGARNFDTEAMFRGIIDGKRPTRQMPGFQYQPKGGGAVPPTIGGFPTQIAPAVVPIPSPLDPGANLGPSQDEINQQQALQRDRQKQDADAERERTRREAELAKIAARMDVTQYKSRADFLKAANVEFFRQNGRPEYLAPYMEMQRQIWDEEHPTAENPSGFFAGGKTTANVNAENRQADTALAAVRARREEAELKTLLPQQVANIRSQIASRNTADRVKVWGMKLEQRGLTVKERQAAAAEMRNTIASDRNWLALLREQNRLSPEQNAEVDALKTDYNAVISELEKVRTAAVGQQVVGEEPNPAAQENIRILSQAAAELTQRAAALRGQMRAVAGGQPAGGQPATVAGVVRRGGEDPVKAQVESALERASRLVGRPLTPTERNNISRGIRGAR